MDMRFCKLCGGEYDPKMFYSKKDHAAHRGGICRLCSLTKRAKTQWDNRFLIKARKALKGHAKSRGLTTDDLKHKYGWDPKRMAHDIQHIFDNWCPYCGYPFKEMAHGLKDITLDIFDPKIPPYYSTNTRWVCANCNSTKHQMGPEAWGAFTVYMQQWRSQIERKEKNPWIMLPLFKDLPADTG